MLRNQSDGKAQEHQQEQGQNQTEPTVNVNRRSLSPTNTTATSFEEDHGSAENIEFYNRHVSSCNVREYAYNVYWKYASKAERDASGFKEEPRFTTTVLQIDNVYVANVMQIIEHKQNFNPKWQRESGRGETHLLALLDLEAKYSKLMAEKTASIEKTSI